MSTLQLSLLGSPQIVLDGKPITIKSKKACALLFYLATEQQTHFRSELMDIFWYEGDAQMKLRGVLNFLRKSEFGKTPHFSFPEFGIPMFNRESIYELDVEKFEALLRPNCTIEQMQMAVALYRGNFLQGFEVGNAPRFEEWVVQQQEHFHNLALNVLRKLYHYYKTQKRYELSIRYAQQSLQLEPWLEETHRYLMEAWSLLGQPEKALRQYQLCKRVLAKELDVEPAKETKELYERVRRGQIPPDEAVKDEVVGIVDNKVRVLPPPEQCPPKVGHFIGRFAELTTIVSQLTQPDRHNRVALVGMGGVGKTTLATHVAHELKRHFTDGILWASDIHSEPMAILESWGTAYGHDFSRIPHVEGRAIAFHKLIANKRVLLVVDNVESVARIRPLLPTASRCAVLLTTRHESLARMLQASIFAVDELTLENGRNLLALLLNDNRVQTEPEAADGICTLLSNLPLAIEITARRLALSPSRRLADVADRLRQVKSRLEVDGNHEVRATFELSWETMDLRVQRIFALVGLFEGRSFTADAVAYIAQLEKYPTEDLLINLMTFSLLKEDRDHRYHQHPLLADFANEKLGEQRREENGRFAAYYLSFAQQHQHNYPALRPEWSNLLAGIQLAHKEQSWSLVVTYANTLTPPWFKRGRFSEARQGYTWASAAAQESNDPQTAAYFLHQWGRACIEQQDYPEAEKLLSKSLELYQNLEQPAGVANNKRQLAKIALETALETTNYEESQQLVLESRELCEQIGDLNGIAETWYIEARILYFQGEFKPCKQLAQKALKIQENIEDEAGAILSLSLLASATSELREFDQAQKYALSALQLCQKLHDKGEQAIALDLLAGVYLAQKELIQAQKCAEESLALLRGMGDTRSQAQVLFRLCLIKLEAGEYNQALEVGLQSLALCRELNHWLLMSAVLLKLGDVHQKLAQIEQAHTAWVEGLKIAKELKRHDLTERFQQRLSIAPPKTKK